MLTITDKHKTSVLVKMCSQKYFQTGLRGGTGGGTGERGGGGTEICCILLILLYFYVLQCNNWVSEVSNRRIEVNSGILTMNPALISLHRQGVFR